MVPVTEPAASAASIAIKRISTFTTWHVRVVTWRHFLRAAIRPFYGLARSVDFRSSGESPGLCRRRDRGENFNGGFPSPLKISEHVPRLELRDPTGYFIGERGDNGTPLRPFSSETRFAFRPGIVAQKSLSYGILKSITCYVSLPVSSGSVARATGPRRALSQVYTDTNRRNGAECRWS